MFYKAGFFLAWKYMGLFTFRQTFSFFRTSTTHGAKNKQKPVYLFFILAVDYF